jgi:hypothetical protein
VAAHCRVLPGKAFQRLDAFEPRQQAIDQPGQHVGAQGEPRRLLPGALALDPRTLQKRRMRQDIRRGAELVEQLLGRVQGAIPAVMGA